MEHLEKYMQVLSKKGKIKVNGGLLSWLWGRAGTGTDNSSARVPEATPTGQPATQTQQENETGGATQEVEPVRWNAMHEAELPAGGVFDLQELSRWNAMHEAEL